jgi:N-acetylglucosaminyldiphosphoundecaprenol N-acetyl-beta-D-mannosaminyltransferase
MRSAPAESLFGSRPPIAIMGVPFDNVTSEEAIALIEQMIASRRPHYLVTPNVDFLVQATHDVELRRILFEAHLVVCDGTPLVWSSRLLGNPLPERVAGADLVPKLIRVAAQKGYRIFFLGASPAAVEQAVARLHREYPDLHIAGYYSPPFADLLEMDHDQIRQRILAASPDLLFVAFGCPKQEKWIAMHYRSLGVPLTAGVGGTIDFLGGTVKRAPVWMQKSGAEWMFRLLQEPRRLFRRYAQDLWAFGWSIVPQWWRMKGCRAFKMQKHLPAITRGTQPLTSASLRNAHSKLTSSPIHAEACECIPIPEQFDLLAARQYAAWTAKIRKTKHHWLLDMSAVRFIDSTGVGLLIQWKKLAQDRGCETVLMRSTPVLHRALTLLQLEDFFLHATDEMHARQVIETKIRNQLVRPIPLADAGVISLEWHGEITAANSAKVWKLTQAYLAKTATPRQWLIDLSNVRFLDSSGLGLMVRLKKWASQSEAGLLFTGLQPAVHNVVRLARLEEFLLGA